jgi:hypothetical protein
MFRGDDTHVEWASYGTRTIMLRLAEPGPEFKSGIAAELWENTSNRTLRLELRGNRFLMK